MGLTRSAHDVFALLLAQAALYIRKMIVSLRGINPGAHSFTLWMCQEWIFNWLEKAYEERF